MIKLGNYLLVKNEEGVIHAITRKENKLELTKLTVPQKCNSKTSLDEFLFDDKTAEQKSAETNYEDLPDIISYLFRFYMREYQLFVTLSKEGVKALKMVQEESVNFEYENEETPLGILYLEKDNCKLILPNSEVETKQECKIDDYVFVDQENFVFSYVDKPIELAEFVRKQFDEAKNKTLKTTKVERVNEIFSKLSETELTKEQKELLGSLTEEIGAINPFDVQDIVKVNSF